MSAPLIDLDMFRRSRIVALGSAASLLNYTAMFGAIALTAVLLEVVGGYSPSETGLVMMAQPLVMVALSPVAGHLSDTLGSRALASGGMLILAGGLTILAMTPSDLPLWHIVLGLAVSGLGMAAFSSPNTSAVMGAVEHDRLGVAAAVLAMMRTLGQTLSLAILGTLAAAPLGAAGAGVLFGATGGRRPRVGLPRRLPHGHGRGGGDRGGRRVPVAEPRAGGGAPLPRPRRVGAHAAQVGGALRRPQTG